MSEDGRLGEFRALPEGVQLRFRRSWPQPVADVWSALTDPDRLLRWLGSYEGERRRGGTGTFTMTHEAEPVAEPMTVVECDAPRRLLLEWSGQETWRVGVDLSEEAGEAVLVLTQLLATETGARDVAAGWHWYLDKLDAEVRGAPPPPGWATFLTTTGPAYGLAPEG